MAGLAVSHHYWDGGAWRRRDEADSRLGGPGLRHREPTDRATPAGRRGHRRPTGLDISAAVARLGSSTAPGSTDGLVSPRCWSVSPTNDVPKMEHETARDASETRLRPTRAPSPIEPNIFGRVTAGWATVAAWPASPAGLVVCGGEANGVNFEAAAEELA